MRIAEDVSPKGSDHRQIAAARHLRSVAVATRRGIVGWVQAELLGEIDEALRLHLAL
ncbi:hypothetical protein [Microbacterium mangrovi]|uniref:hypothetical protein n=1 Tax=Microbacterium mangrovi TaxID=1348253 RepID=UPI0018CDC636|nr:hypothetical protein [Microbacterium mangrovi]